MSSATDLSSYLEKAFVASEVFQLRPDYRALLIAVAGITPRPSDATSEAALVEAEALAKQSGDKTEHIAAWREVCPVHSCICYVINLLVCLIGLQDVQRQPKEEQELR